MPAAESGTAVRLPLGMLGFEQFKDYVLLAHPEEAPFCWLQMVEKPALAFLVIEPFQVLPDYKPDLPEQDVDFLALRTPSDALVYNIVTVRGPTQATINLKGPIVLNRHTRMGKQVIPNNAVHYSVQHPLPVDE